MEKNLTELCQAARSQSSQVAPDQSLKERLTAADEKMTPEQVQALSWTDKIRLAQGKPLESDSPSAHKSGQHEGQVKRNYAALAMEHIREQGPTKITE